MTERAFIDAHGPDDDAIRHGFRWLFEVSVNGQAAVFVPGVKQLSNLASAIGSGAANALHKHRQVQSGGITIHALVQRQLPMAFDGPILAIWVDDKQLQRLEALRPSAILAIPWNRADIGTWKANWGPTDYRSGEAAERAEALDPVARTAIRSLSESVNLSGALSHPMDKDKAVATLRALKKAGIIYSPASIESEAVQNGWQADDASQLADLAQRVLDGRRIQTRSNPWRPDIVEIWREDAAAEAASAEGASGSSRDA